MNVQRIGTIGIIFLTCAAGTLLSAQTTVAAPVEKTAAAPSREQARERLTSQLDQLRERQDQLAQALDMLDNNADLGEIRQFMMENAGGKRGPGPRFDGEGRPGPGAADGKRRHRGPKGTKAQAKDLTPEQMDEALELLDELNPRIAERLRNAMKDDPEAARRAAGRFAPRLRELNNLRDRDPEAFQHRTREMGVGREIRGIVMQIRSASPDDLAGGRLDNYRVQLTDLISNQLDLHAERRLQEIEHTEERLERLHEEVISWQTEKDDLVKERVDELITNALEGGPLKPNRDDLRDTRPEKRERQARPKRRGQRDR